MGTRRRYMLSNNIIIVVSIFLAFFMLFSISVKASPKRILVFHSYQESLLWTRDVNQGIRDYMAESDLDYVLYYEYMDSKKYHNYNYYLKLVDLYAYKYEDKKFDLIIASDNNAMDFLNHFSFYLFKDTPVIFTGINNFNENQVAGIENHLIVHEDPPLKETIDLALNMHPDTENILIYGSETSTYQNSKESLQKIMPLYQERVNFIFKEGLTINDIVTDISQQAKNSIILLLTTLSEDERKPLSYANTARELSLAADIPVYSTWDFFLGEGILGGKVISGKTMGENAASLAAEYLQGRDFNDLNHIPSSEGNYIFDYQQLKRYNISEKTLPEGSIVLNLPDSFWQIERRVIFIIGVAFLLMLFFIVYLVKTIHKYKKTQQELEKEKEFSERLVFYDNLTSLPNMVYFRRQVANELSKSGEKLLAIIMLDLDRFRLINDIYGRNFGDRIIMKISQRLVSFFTENTTVCRISSDDFAILLTNKEEIERIEELAERLSKIISVPIFIDDEEFFVQASMGISIYPGDGANMDLLLKAADSALHKTKEMVDTNYQLYNREMHVQNTRRLFIEKNLVKAIKRKELEVYYQPLIDLLSNDIIGGEALIRWQHPEKGMISPEEFIPIAEETGDILAIGDYVMKEACSQFTNWFKEGHDPGFLSINLSPRQFTQEDLIKRIEEILKETKFDRKKLILEITETAAILNPGSTEYIIKKFKEMGIKLMLDDFGTGYSSLNYLSRFPVSGLKIDRCFINQLDKGKEDELLVAAIIAMAGQLGIEVVAEGVETKEQLNFLKKHKCKYTQGYFYHPPVPAKDYINIIRRNAVRN
ncbi:MAG: EAL domain-containing protein [bacterium]